nr:acyl carrier protein 3, mitochondrial [Ipomoea batatas]
MARSAVSGFDILLRITTASCSTASPPRADSTLDTSSSIALQESKDREMLSREECLESALGNLGELQTKGLVDSEGEIGGFGFKSELENVARIQRLAKQQGFLGERRRCRAEIIRHFPLEFSELWRKWRSMYKELRHSGLVALQPRRVWCKYLLLNMQSLRSSILSYVRVRVSLKDMVCPETPSLLNLLSQRFCTPSASTATGHDQTMERVINLVKKFDKIDATKVNILVIILKSLPSQNGPHQLDNFGIELCICPDYNFKSQIPIILQVTERADFQKDLSFDSLDRVELVMAFEQEFSIEIPDEEADKLKCCADVARYISVADRKVSENS